MSWTGRNTVGPIGVDIGSRFIKAVQVAGRDAKARVVAATAVPRTKTGAVIEQDEITNLGEILFRQGFVGQRVVLSAPSESLLVGSLSLPPRQSGAPVDEIARMELARIHKQDPSGFELVHWELPGTAGGSGPASRSGSCAVMAAACPHTEANHLVDLFEAANMEVVGIDVPWLAMARACLPLVLKQGKNAEGASAMTAILDLGWNAARLVVLRQDVIVFERVLTEGGLKKLSGNLREKLQIDESAVDLILSEVGCGSLVEQEQASDRRSASNEDGFNEPRRLICAHCTDVMEELKVSLTYALQQYRSEGIDHLILTGGGAVPGLAALWGKAMQLEVVTAKLGELLTCKGGTGRHDASPMLTMALGLSKYEE